MSRGLWSFREVVVEDLFRSRFVGGTRFCVFFSALILIFTSQVAGHIPISLTTSRRDSIGQPRSLSALATTPVRTYGLWRVW